MKIDYVEIGSFRKLQSVRIDFAPEQTIFVGANNSGKTSAMVVLRRFLIERGRFSINDFTLDHWHTINQWGEAWDAAFAAENALPSSPWADVVPTVDIWLSVADTEFHHVRGILPTLDWNDGQLGVRLVLEPKDPVALQREYVAVRATNERVQAAALAAAKAELSATTVHLWPQCLTDFLSRRLVQLFKISAYILDPDKCQPAEAGIAKLQILPVGAEPLDSNPLKSLIRVDEISAQRGFGQSDDAGDDEENGVHGEASGSRRLSDQLKRYYARHLDPFEVPDARDFEALQAIELAQKAFNERLSEGFSDAIGEMEGLGYPGVTNPHIEIATRVRPIEGMNHDSAVQYVVSKAVGSTKALTLPEHYNGLGYQNLVSMVFRLMSFRDGWLKVKKAASKAAKQETSTATDGGTPLLHIVLVEEPEAHLHVQVQQVFIRQAYRILRNNGALKDDKTLSTQLIVSTHSSHVAHECDFSALRYFRRLSPPARGVPTAGVINLTKVFGDEDETKRFVTRYLRVTHADLLFADAAVLVEGPAERILIPQFIRESSDLRRLHEAYITWLEIGGSHAHRLRGLVEQLGIPTLIVTDIDATDADGKSVPPKRGAKHKTRNATLKHWCPEKDDLDTLVDLDDLSKCKEYKSENFSVRVAYQHAFKIAFKGQADVEVIPYTFEDALVYENADLFSRIKGTGLVAKIQKAVSDAGDVGDLSERLHGALKGGGKAAFAMDMLEVEGKLNLKAPRYIESGLNWLKDQVKVRQDALLGVVPGDGQVR